MVDEVARANEIVAKVSNAAINNFKFLATEEPCVKIKSYAVGAVTGGKSRVCKVTAKSQGILSMPENSIDSINLIGCQDFRKLLAEGNTNLIAKVAGVSIFLFVR